MWPAIVEWSVPPYLLSGPLESTNEPYAIAKIAGIKMCEAYNRQHGTNYFAVMPTNLYGAGDHYDLENSHVLPALIRKMEEAKTEVKNMAAEPRGTWGRWCSHVSSTQVT